MKIQFSMVYIFHHIPQIPLTIISTPKTALSLGLWLRNNLDSCDQRRVALSRRWMDALRRSGGTPNQGCFLAILMALCKKNRMTEAEWTVQETADILDAWRSLRGLAIVWP